MNLTYAREIDLVCKSLSAVRVLVANNFPLERAAEAFRVAQLFFYQAEDGIRYWSVTGVQTCALPIYDLQRALELQKERGDKLGKILVDMGLIAQRDVLAALSDQLGVPLVTVDGAPVSAPEIEGLSNRFLRQCRAFPLALANSTLTLAMADPLDFETISAVRAFTGFEVQTVLAAEQG